MHYATLAIVSREDNPGASIDDLVSEELGDEASWWDWWQIGGRWTGYLDGYDPSTDPANKKPCDLCGASGSRRDNVGRANGMHKKKIDEEGHPRNGQVGWCNGCNGTGSAEVWPTQWKRREGDAIPLSALTQEQLDGVHFVKMIGNDVFSRERYVPWAEQKFQPTEMPPLDWIKSEVENGFAVIVDVHN